MGVGVDEGWVQAARIMDKTITSARTLAWANLECCRRVVLLGVFIFFSFCESKCVFGLMNKKPPGFPGGLNLKYVFYRTGSPPVILCKTWGSDGLESFTGQSWKTRTSARGEHHRLRIIIYMFIQVCDLPVKSSI